MPENRALSSSAGGYFPSPTPITGSEAPLLQYLDIRISPLVACLHRWFTKLLNLNILLDLSNRVLL